jgi:hypothetical protein
MSRLNILFASCSLILFACLVLRDSSARPPPDDGSVANKLESVATRLARINDKMERIVMDVVSSPPPDDNCPIALALAEIRGETDDLLEALAVLERLHHPPDPCIPPRVE